MADTSVSYKCPNCGAPLSFLPGKKTVTCEYCGTEFEVSAIEELFRDKQEMAVHAAQAQEAKWDTDDAGSEWSSDEAAALIRSGETIAVNSPTTRRRHCTRSPVRVAARNLSATKIPWRPSAYTAATRL